MQDIKRDDTKKVYEIGYHLLSSIPKEKVADSVIRIKDVLINKGADIIGEEAPELIPLSYTMIKKIGTTNHRFDQAFFGWVKFELSTSVIEEVKKTLDLNEDILRYMIITTVRDNTYLGKKAPVVPGLIAEAEGVPVEAVDVPVDKVSGADELDKSIDEMVKEA